MQTINEFLFKASAEGNLKVVKFLVENGASIHEWSDFPLQLAVKYGHLKVVKYLVKKGANIHLCYDDELEYAARNGHTEVVEYIKSLQKKSK